MAINFKTIRNVVHWRQILTLKRFSQDITDQVDVFSLTYLFFNIPTIWQKYTKYLSKIMAGLYAN